MEPARKKCKNNQIARKLWELNICVCCTQPLASTSKLLKCLHGVCNQCINLGSKKPSNFVCKCGAVTDISKELINCTLFCEPFDKLILRNNYMDKKYQREVYGQYRTKAPCPNCDDKYIEIYCITCNKLHCALCHLLKHRSHKCRTIGKVMEDIRSTLMQNKVDLCVKASFVEKAKKKFTSNIATLKTQNIEIKKEIKNTFKELRAELDKSEKQMMENLYLNYTSKMKHLVENKTLMDGLEKKYNFYLYFSESTLKKENMVDLDIVNLTNNQLLNVRKDFTMDINRFGPIADSNVDLNVNFDDTLNQLLESIKTISFNRPQTYRETVDAITQTTDISSFEKYQSVTKEFDGPRYIIDNGKMDIIIKFNCLKLNKKMLKTSCVFPHLCPRNEIQALDQCLSDKEKNSKNNNRKTNNISKRKKKINY